MSNMGLYKALEKKGILYTQTKVGDRFVHEYMMEHACVIGGEQSGHIILSRYLNTGDGILTALVLSSVMKKTGKSLLELSSDMTDYPQVLVNVVVSDKKSVMEDSAVKKKIDDETKKLHGCGRILVRPSGTEPVIRVMSEAEEQTQAEKAVEAIVETLREQGYFKGVR